MALAGARIYTQGFNIALTAGYIDKQNIRRPYAGLDVSVTNVRDKGSTVITVRLGSYFYRKRFEDVDLLVSADYFTGCVNCGRPGTIVCSLPWVSPPGPTRY